MSELNFACLDLEYIHFTNAILMSTITNNPCHATLYHTDIEPRRHQTTRIVRGLAVPWSTYFCFVGWQAVEQNEPGDTLFHTFNVTPWTLCETKYFTIRATVAAIDSPSCSAIFKHHHPGVSDLTIWTQIATDTEDCRAFKWSCQSCPSLCPPILSAGYFYSIRKHMGSGLRFQLDQLPRLAQITSAKLIFTAWQTLTGTCRYTRIRAEWDSNPPDFANETWYTLIARWANAGLSIDWDNIEPWYAETQYDSPDISTIIQQLVNQSWWQQPQPIVLFWDDWDNRTGFLPYQTRRAYSQNRAPNKAVWLQIAYEY